jgi:hypothetical protein
MKPEIMERKEVIMNNTINRTKVKEELSTMLECILNKDTVNCNCKQCEKIDACCFLAEAVFVCNYKERKKTASAP